MLLYFRRSSAAEESWECHETGVLEACRPAQPAGSSAACMPGCGLSDTACCREVERQCVAFKERMRKEQVAAIKNVRAQTPLGGCAWYCGALYSPQRCQLAASSAATAAASTISKPGAATEVCACVLAGRGGGKAQGGGPEPDLGPAQRHPARSGRSGKRCAAAHHCVAPR